MQQKKFLNSPKFSKFKFSKKTTSPKNLSKVYLFKKYLKNKSYSLGLNLNKSLTLNKKTVYKINILFKSNNFFCTLTNLEGKKIFYTISSGNYSIKTSKKLLKHTFKLVLERFFRVIYKKIRHSSLLIKIAAPAYLRKKVLDLIVMSNIKTNIIIQIQKSKCYNGCRPPKRQRKKRKGLKLLK